MVESGRQPIAVFGLVLTAVAAVLLWRWESGSAGGLTSTGDTDRSAQQHTTPEVADGPSQQANARTELAKTARVVGRPTDPDFVAALCGFTGRCVDPDGKPVAGVRVEVWDSVFMVGGVLPCICGLDQDDVRKTAVTETDGKFRVTGLWPHVAGDYKLVVEDPEWLMSAADVETESLPPPGDLFDFGDVLVVRTRSVIGRVIDERGSPRTGVQVFASTRLDGDHGDTELSGGYSRMFDPNGMEVNSWDEGFVVGSNRRFTGRVVRAVTGRDGRFRLPGLANSPVTLTISAGVLPVSHQRQLGAPGSVLDVGDLVLRKGKSLRGSVVDRLGQPVPGAQVFVGDRGTGPRNFAWFGVMAAVTDASGRFEIEDSPPGPLAVGARARPWQRWTMVADIGPSQPVTIELPATHSLVLHVLDPAGQGVAGADVRVFGDPEFAFLTEDGLRRGEGLPVQIDRGTDGRLELHGLSPAEYEVEVRADGVGSARSKVSIDGDLEREIRLRPESSFEVIATDRRGRPVQGARVRVEGIGCHTWRRAGWTDRSGRLSIARPAKASFRLWVDHPRYAAGSAEVDDTRTSARVVLPDPTGVAIEVFGPPGFRFERWSVSLSDRQDDMNSETVELDARGRGLARLAKGGSYKVDDVGRDHGRAGHMIADSPDLTFHVAQGETARVVIHLPATQYGPVRGSVHVEGLSPGELELRHNVWSMSDEPIRVNAFGQFEIAELFQDYLYLELFAGQGMLWSGSLSLEPGVAANLDIELRTGTVRGKVVDPSRRPVQARVWLAGKSEPGPGLDCGGVLLASKTDARGRYAFATVPAGTYAVLFRGKPLFGGSQVEHVVVSSGKTTTVDAELKPRRK